MLLGRRPSPHCDIGTAGGRSSCFAPGGAGQAGTRGLGAGQQQTEPSAGPSHRLGWPFSKRALPQFHRAIRKEAEPSDDPQARLNHCCRLRVRRASSPGTWNLGEHRPGRQAPAPVHSCLTRPPWECAVREPRLRKARQAACAEPPSLDLASGCTAQACPLPSPVAPSREPRGLGGLPSADVA